MYQVVRQLIDSNEGSWQSIPAFVSVFNQFKSKLELLKSTSEKRSLATKGKTSEKQFAKDAVTKSGRVLIGALSAFASNEQQFELLSSLPARKSQFELATHANLQIALATVQEAAVEHASALLEYGISEAMLADFESKIASYLEASSKPRMGVANHKKLSADLNVIVKEVDELLSANLDKLMEVVGATDGDLFKKYKIYRNIINYPTTHKKDGEAPDSEISFEL